MLVIATLALAEDAPPDETTPPASTESSAPEPSPSADPVPSTEPSQADPAPSEPGPGSVDPSPASEPPPSAEPAAAPTITSDKDDYPPGGAVILTGANWQPGEQVHIRVNDDAGETWRRDVDVVSDNNGNIRDEFTLPNWFVATYTVTATGSSGSVTSTFTDSNPQTITVTPASRTVVQGATAAYSMTLVVGGNNNPCTVTFSVTGLPTGASASFGTNPFTTIGNDLTTPLNITTTASTPTGSFPFTVNGTNSGDGCQGPGATFVIPAPTLVITAANTAPVVDLNGGAAGIDYTTTFTEDGGAVAAVDSTALTVSDVDSANIASATATLTNRPGGNAESLAVTGGSCVGITVTAYNSSTGVLALSGSATKATYQSCLRTLTYNNSDQDPDTNPRSITVKVNDGSLDSALATSLIFMTGVNDAPTIDLNGAGSGVDTTASYTEDAAPTVLAPAAVVADVDDVSLIGGSVQLTINPPSGTVVPDLPDEVLLWDSSPGGVCDGLTVNYNTSTGTLIINGAASVGLYQTCLRSMAYENARDAMDVRNRNVEFTVFDAHSENATSNRPDVTLTLVPVNDAPVAADDTRTMAEDSAPVTIDLRTLVSDAETADAFLTYTIVSDPVASAGTLTGLGTNGTYSFDSADNFNGTATFTYKVTDRGDPDACSPVSTHCTASLDSATKTVTITVNAVNDAPECQDVSITTDEDTPGETDPDCTDVDGDPLTYTVSAATNGTSGFAAGKITYDPDLNFNGPDSFTYTADDGNGGTDTANVAVTVNAVNDAPANTVPGAQTTAEDTTKVFSAGNGNQIQVADADVAEAAGGKLRVTLSATHGTLTLSGITGLVFTTGDGTGDSSMVFSGSPAAVNPALEGLSFVPTLNFNGSAQLSITTNDQGNTGSGGAKADTDTVSISVTPVNDAPEIDSVTFPSSSVSCPSAPGTNNASLTVAFHDVDLGDTHTATIDWDSDPTTLADKQSVGVVASPFTVGHSYPAPGSYTATVTVSDLSLVDDATASVVVNYAVVGGAFKQPVNNTRNGQPVSIFKHGSTIPLKLEVTDCAGNHPSGIEIRVYWQKIDGGTPQGELEAIATNFPDTGNLMRLVDSNYMFNWNTKLVSDPTATVRIQATIVATGQVIFSDIGLKK